MTEKNKNKIKEYRIIVNAREKLWLQKEITFDDIVVLAFGLVKDVVTYTVIYKKGHGNKPEGQLIKGDVIEVKEDMVFNATQTNRS